MIVSGIIDEDYGKCTVPIMVISVSSDGIQVKNEDIIKRYMVNSAASTIWFDGEEPLTHIDEIIKFISVLRNDYYCDDAVVIETHCQETEAYKQINTLKTFRNISIYINNQMKKIV